MSSFSTLAMYRFLVVLPFEWDEVSY